MSGTITKISSFIFRKTKFKEKHKRKNSLDIENYLAGCCGQVGGCSLPTTQQYN